MAGLIVQHTQLLNKIRPLVRDANELMAQMEALKERFNKVMNRMETRKRFVDQVGNSIHRTIYMMDRCKGELMSRENNQRDGISRGVIHNLNVAQSDVNAVNNALEVNAEVLPSLHAKLLGFSSLDSAKG